MYASLPIVSLRLDVQPIRSSPIIATWLTLASPLAHWVHLYALGPREDLQLYQAELPMLGRDQGDEFEGAELGEGRHSRSVSN
jgi:hypothetical protein